MTIGIDGNEANIKRRVGVGEYAFELLKQFSNSKFIHSTSFHSDDSLERAGQNSKFVIYLKDRPLDDLPVASENWKYCIVKPKKFWTQLGLPIKLYISLPRPDVFFTPSHYAPRFSPIPTVISIMDLSYIHFPQLFRKKDLYQLKHWTSYSIKNAKKILTISKSSKDDIIKEYKVEEDRIVVTYPGVKNAPSMRYQVLSMDKFEKKYGVHGKYVLFVGTLQPRKNISRLIEAFSMLKEDLNLVIVGKRGWLYEEILMAPQKFKVEEKVKFLDFVSDEDLPYLYKNALCFILPSLYEGFGLPVLEAMKYGCPVIVSNISSLPEAGGDATLYVDPLDTLDIKKNLELIINNEELRNKLIQKGYKQVEKFSWEKTAKDTLKVLEEVADEKKH